jgi:hypothetical protein
LSTSLPYQLDRAPHFKELFDRKLLQKGGAVVPNQSGKKSLLTATSSFTTIGWTMFLTVIIWFINYQFVTPGESPKADEISIWIIVSFFVVVAFRSLYARMRRSAAPKR